MPSTPYQKFAESVAYKYLDFINTDFIPNTQQTFKGDLHRSIENKVSVACGECVFSIKQIRNIQSLTGETFLVELCMFENLEYFQQKFFIRDI